MTELAQWGRFSEKKYDVSVNIDNSNSRRSSPLYTVGWFTKTKKKEKTPKISRVMTILAIRSSTKSLKSTGKKEKKKIGNELKEGLTSKLELFYGRSKNSLRGHKRNETIP